MLLYLDQESAQLSQKKDILKPAQENVYEITSGILRRKQTSDKKCNLKWSVCFQTINSSITL